MLRGAQAAMALAVLFPLATASAQLRVTGILQGSLTLLPPAGPLASGGLASGPSLSLASAPAAVGGGAPHRARMAHLTPIVLDPFVADQAVAPASDARLGAPIEAVVTSNRDSLLVWAPAADRVELRIEDDGEASRTVECPRAADDAAEPARCSAPEGQPSKAIARATLTVYYGLSGSR
jgi:hypothetical protein